MSYEHAHRLFLLSRDKVLNKNRVIKDTQKQPMFKKAAPVTPKRVVSQGPLFKKEKAEPPKRATYKGPMFKRDVVVTPQKRVAVKPVISNNESKPIKSWDSKLNYICEPDGPTYTSDTTGLIVTMTSWQKRIGNVAKTVKTILENTMRPEKIIINLATEEFPGKEKDLPKELLELVNNNSIIEIYWLKHNTTVWKKTIPTLMRFKKAMVICIDDDALYPKTFIKTFYDKALTVKDRSITGANVSFMKGIKQHCGCASLDRYSSYGEGLNFINDKVMALKSSDTVLTAISAKMGHENVYLGTNYLSVAERNNPVSRHSSGMPSLSRIALSANTLFDEFEKCPIKGRITINVLITTYNRVAETKQLVDQLLSYRGEKYDIKVAVWDDCLAHRFDYKSEHVSVFHNKENRGKQGFWITWNEMFEYCKANKSQFYLFLQDDHILRDNFFDTMIETWYRLPAPICLAPLIEDSSLENGVSRWGNKRHQKIFPGVLKTQWFDCNGLVTDAFFDALNWKLQEIPASRWNANPSLSSGVGQQITTRLQSLNKNMYHMAPTMILLHAIKSEMNAEERAKNALETHLNKQIRILNCCTDIIVSLTSYKDRLPYIKPVIDSILKGTLLPQKIVLTLYKEDVKYIPVGIKEYINEGIVELIKTDEDIKPHKKYFYVMQKYRNNPIVTIDDDIIYTNDLLATLNDSYKKYPNCVSARRARIMKYNANNVASNYNGWALQTRKLNEPSFDLLPTGAGGVLYPPNILGINETMLSDIRKCLNTDDIYLKWLEMKKGIKIAFVYTGGKYWEKDIDNADTRKNALFATNRIGGNDKCLEVFKITKK